jgi:hypothetical protein
MTLGTVPAYVLYFCRNVSDMPDVLHVVTRSMVMNVGDVVSAPLVISVQKLKNVASALL